MFDIRSKQGKDDRFVSPTFGTLPQLYEQPFLILIPSVFWQWVQVKLGGEMAILSNWLAVSLQVCQS